MNPRIPTKEFASPSNTSAKSKSFLSPNPNSNLNTISSTNPNPIANTPGFLLKRKDFVSTDKDARTHPNRTYFFKSYDLESIIQTCTKKLLSDPRNVTALFLRSNSYQKQNNYHASLRDLNLLLTIDPKHIEGYYLKGVCYSKIGREKDAIDEFTKVLEMDENYVNAAFARAACYNTIGQFSEAIQDYNLALLKDQSVNSNNSNSLNELNVSVNSIHSNSRRSRNSSGIGRGSALLFDDNVYGSNQGNESGKHNAESHKDSVVSILPFSPQAEINANILKGLGKATVVSEGDQSEAKSLASTYEPLSHPDYSKPLTNSYLFEENFSPPPRPATGIGAENRMYALESTGAASSSTATNDVLDTNGNSMTLSDHHHAMGYQYRQMDDYLSAINEYTKAIQSNPLNFKAWFNRGFANDKMGKYTEAIADYGKALEIDPKSAFAYYNRGISFDRQGHYEMAYEDFVMAIHLNKNNADFYHNKAFCLRKMGRLEEAIAEYTNAIQLQPTHFKALSNRAYCYERLSKYQEALTDYSKAIELHKKHYGALASRGYIYEFLGNYEEAVSDMTNALLYLEEAIEHLKKQKKDENIMKSNVNTNSKMLEEMNNLIIQKYSLLSTRCKIFEKCRQYQKAVLDYCALITHHHENDANYSDVKYYYSRGLCYKAMAQYNEACMDFKQCILLVIPRIENNLNSKSSYQLGSNGSVDTDENSLVINAVDAYMNIGYCCRKMEQYQEAVLNYSKIITLLESQEQKLSENHNSIFKPYYLKTYNNRGYCYAKMNQFQNAVTDYGLVIKLDSNNSHAYHNRGISLDKLGLTDRAIADFTKVLELDGKNTNTNANPNIKHIGVVDDVSMGTVEKRMSDENIESIRNPPYPHNTSMNSDAIPLNRDYLLVNMPINPANTDTNLPKAREHMHKNTVIRKAHNHIVAGAGINKHWTPISGHGDISSSIKHVTSSEIGHEGNRVISQQNITSRQKNYPTVRKDMQNVMHKDTSPNTINKINLHGTLYSNPSVPISSPSKRRQPPPVPLP